MIYSDIFHTYTVKHAYKTTISYSTFLYHNLYHEIYNTYIFITKCNNVYIG